MNYTPQEILARKWKRTGLMDGILPEHEGEYAERLEEAGKKLIANYGGKGQAPNVWPSVRRQFEADKGIKV